MYIYIIIGNACRKIATIREFASPQVAEKELEKQMDMATKAATTQCAMSEHGMSKSSETEFTKQLNVLMSKVKNKEILSLLYSKLADSHSVKIPNDYLQLSFAMKHLRESGRSTS